MASVIVGATSLDQLRTDIAAADLTLPDEVMAGIAEIHQAHPIPL
jgi:aryl-alcohol dehydrogenase-like predicted oxidoreductase